MKAPNHTVIPTNEYFDLGRDRALLDLAEAIWTQVTGESLRETLTELMSSGADTNFAQIVDGYRAAQKAKRRGARGNPSLVAIPVQAPGRTRGES